MPKGVYKHYPHQLFQKGNTFFKGKHHTEEARKKIKEAQEKKIGFLNNNWKGDKAGKKAIHIWIYGKLGKPLVCESCGVFVKERKLNWANKNHEYRRNLEDWLSFCYSCHRKYDLKYNNTKLQNHYLINNGMER